MTDEIEKKIIRVVPTEARQMDCDSVDTSCTRCNIRAASGFGCLTDQKDLQVLDGIRKSKKFSAGDILTFREGEKFGFYCLYQGHVKLSVIRNFEKKIVRVCGPGDLVGFHLTEDAADSYVATAIDEGVVCFFSRENFDTAIRTSPEIAAAVIRAMNVIIQTKDDRIAALENQSVRSRVSSALLTLNHKFGEPSPFGTRIGIRMDRQTLALLAGTVVESLARTLKDLEEESLIHREGREIHIVDSEKLRVCSQ